MHTSRISDWSWARLQDATLTFPPGLVHNTSNWQKSVRGDGTEHLVLRRSR
jgi:hypothetical protein